MQNFNNPKINTKRALLIGINYIGQNAELNGCINDVYNMKSFLESKKIGFEEKNVIVMHDANSSSSELFPTKNNIIHMIKKVISDTKQGDLLFVHYSGHGSYITLSFQEAYKKGETDRRDETICPVDFQTNGMIVDDDIRKLLIDTLSEGVIFRGIFDCCHSGTMLDLRYNFSLKLPSNNVSYRKNLQLPVTKCDAKMISGCTDEQTSADAFINNKATGALTHAFLKVHEENDNTFLSCADLLKKTAIWLSENHFSQRPELSSGKNLNVYKESFICFL